MAASNSTSRASRAVVPRRAATSASKATHTEIEEGRRLDTAHTDEPSSFTNPFSFDELKKGDSTTPMESAQLFLTEAAHDIRAPLATASQLVAAVVENAQLAREQQLESVSPRQTNLASAELDLLKLAQHRLVQLNAWVEGILLDTRFTNDQPVRRRFYPSQWLAGMRAMLEQYAGLKDVKLRWEGWDRSLPKLYMDPIHLSRIVLNLITNAVHASSSGQEIHLRISFSPSAGGRIQLSVVDRAGGLPMQVQTEVNQPHVGKLESTARGFGLRIAKKLTLELGGQLNARAIDGGTEFLLSLPIDNLDELVHAWLVQSSAAQSERVEIQQHLIRVKHLEDAAKFDRRIQLLSRNQLTYRLSNDKWLCITGHAAGFHGVDDWLNEFCAEQQVEFPQARILHKVAACTSWSRKDDENFIRQLAREVSGQASVLIGDLVPQVDPTVSQPHESCGTMLLRPQTIQDAGRVRVPRDVSRGRMPEAEKTLALDVPPGRAKVAEQDTQMYKALRELSQEWRKTQYRMQHVHGAHTKTRTRPAGGA